VRPKKKVEYKKKPYKSARARPQRIIEESDSEIDSESSVSVRVVSKTRIVKGKNP
jgi:hypothetical protein